MNATKFDISSTSELSTLFYPRRAVGCSREQKPAATLGSADEIDGVQFSDD